MILATMLQCVVTEYFFNPSTADPSEHHEKSADTTKSSKSEKYHSKSQYSRSSIEKQDHRRTPPTGTPEKYKSSAPKDYPKKASSKNKPPMPVVRLRSSSEDDSSEVDCNNFDEEREKELRMLRLLKSGLAAKAKESLEKKIPKTYADSFTAIVPAANLNAIASKEESLVSYSYKNEEKHTHVDPNAFDIKMLPLKRDKSPLTLSNVELLKNNVASDDDLAYDSKEQIKKSRQSSLSKSSRSRSNSKSKSKSKERKTRSRSSSVSSYR